MKNITLVSLQKNGAAPLDTLEFSNALAAIGKRHTVIISAGNELREYFTETKFRNVRTVETFASKKSAAILSTLGLVRPRRLYQALKATKPDIVFSTHFHPWLWIVGRYARKQNIQWWYAIHESPFWNKEGRGSIENKLELSFLKRAHRIFCYSNFIARNLASNLPEAKITTLFLGAYSSGIAMAQSSKELPPKNPRKVRIVCIGRIAPHKGIETLLESFCLLRKNRNDFEFVIAGSGMLPEYVPNDPDCIIIKRWLSIAEVAELYRNADIVAVPYWNASQSASPAWALASGKPVVATRTGGLSEQVLEHQTGLLVPIRDAQAFAEALQQLMVNPEIRRRLGKNALALGHDVFSWQEVARRVRKEIEGASSEEATRTGR